MNAATTMARDAAFDAALRMLVAEVKKGDPSHRHVAAAYVLAELGFRKDDIAPIAAHLGRIERAEAVTSLIRR